MRDIPQLLRAAINAYGAGATDLAGDFAERALRELRRGPGAVERERESRTFKQRALRFLNAFLEAPDHALPLARARELAVQVFAQAPRTVGPAFYRPGYVESSSDGRVVLTRRGLEFRKRLVDAINQRGDRR